ncbi:hypothetical protein T492DRAFT_1123315 [Pavlovales sp. CCMP2436]|nr:hypothetical protein T492DRAFT_1123315 [Pavlovales sp. CCMP2436]
MSPVVFLKVVCVCVCVCGWEGGVPGMSPGAVPASRRREGVRKFQPTRTNELFFEGFTDGGWGGGVVLVWCPDVPAHPSHWMTTGAAPCEMTGEGFEADTSMGVFGGGHFNVRVQIDQDLAL